MKYNEVANGLKSKYGNSLKDLINYLKFSFRKRSKKGNSSSEWS